MDGGNSLNIIYLETLDLLGIERAQLQPSTGGFHGVVPGKKALPVGRIDLLVCFGTTANFRKETITFEVVGFRGTYHAIIGRPGYAKFMPIPNYTYLKLMMPGPRGVITISSSYEHAYECDVECIEYGEAVESSVELASRLEALTAEAPEPKRHAGSFEPAEVKALVWFWIIDETLVLTSILSVCRLNEVGTCQVMEQVMIMVMMVMTTR